MGTISRSMGSIVQYWSWQIFLFIVTIILLSSSFIFDSVIAVQLLNTSSGIYAGRIVNHRNIIVRQYLGIEYGRVMKRFERAKPIVRQNDTIINAISFGPICKPSGGSCSVNAGLFTLPSYCPITYGIFAVTGMPAEQCLFLNVFIPVINTTSEQKKPIFMWIHGGSGQIGTGNLFDGTVLAALGDIIVVTFNFRLNLFGFLSSGDERLEGNLGLYDQSMVLDWIYENADALGGDAQRITVAGHSAGAPQAYYLAVSSLNRGRIRRLILQSGTPFNLWARIDAREAPSKFHTVVNDNGCGSQITFDEKLKCLRELHFDLISEHEHHSYTSANHTNVVTAGHFMSTYREEFNPNDPLNDIDILMGSTDDEGVYIAVVPILMDQSDQESITLHNVNFTATALKFLAAMQPNKQCLHHQALELYNITNMCSQFSSDCHCALFYNYSRLISDVLFYNDYYRFIEQRLKYTNRTYIYRYTHPTAQEHPTPCNVYFHRRSLVGHFAELEYTWGVPLFIDHTHRYNNTNTLIKFVRYESNGTNMTTSQPYQYSSEQIRFSEQLILQWSNFIKFGRPETDWPPATVNISSVRIMHLQVNGNELEQLKIPASVQFWMGQCSKIDPRKSRILIKTNQASICVDISYLLLLLVRFISSIHFYLFESN